MQQHPASLLIPPHHVTIVYNHNKSSLPSSVEQQQEKQIKKARFFLPAKSFDIESYFGVYDKRYYLVLTTSMSDDTPTSTLDEIVSLDCINQYASFFHDRVFHIMSPTTTTTITTKSSSVNLTEDVTTSSQTVSATHKNYTQNSTLLAGNNNNNQHLEEIHSNSSSSDITLNSQKHSKARSLIKIEERIFEKVTIECEEGSDNGFYHALSFAIYGSIKCHAQVKSELRNYMARQLFGLSVKKLRAILAGDITQLPTIPDTYMYSWFASYPSLNTNVSIATFICNDESEWSDVMLTVAANLFRTVITLVTDETVIDFACRDVNTENVQSFIYLAYDGAYEHFDALLPVDEDN